MIHPELLESIKNVEPEIIEANIHMHYRKIMLKLINLIESKSPEKFIIYDFTNYSIEPWQHKLIELLSVVGIPLERLPNKHYKIWACGFTYTVNGENYDIKKA